MGKESSENSLKVNKAGRYYYLSTRNFFNEKGLDYRANKIIYDIVEEEYKGNQIFKLIGRVKDRKKINSIL